MEPGRKTFEIDNEWHSFLPSNDFLKCLEAADSARELKRGELINQPDQSLKKNWSKDFADGCARMIAAKLALAPDFKSSYLKIEPLGDQNAEPLVLGVANNSGKPKTKKVDVIVRSNLGLMMALSLKGYNFRDPKNGHFRKNLTGRQYEMESELRAVRERVPSALYGGIHFLPLAAAFDAGPKGTCTLTVLMDKLKQEVRPDRDPYNPVDWHRPDFSYVAVYAPGDIEKARNSFDGYQDPLQRGVVAFFKVTKSETLASGLPPLREALSLEELVNDIASTFRISFN